MGTLSSDVRGPADAALIAQSLARPQVFAAIFERHHAAVHRHLARRGGVERADDLAAATFATAFERRATFRGELGARPWLFAIATNLLRDHWRAERRALEAIDELQLRERVPVAVPAPDGTSAGVAIDSALVQLTPEHRTVILLHAWAGLRYEEIAATLDIPIGTVRSRLARGRARLRELLGESSGGELRDRERSGGEPRYSTASGRPPAAPGA